LFKLMLHKLNTPANQMRFSHPWPDNLNQKLYDIASTQNDIASKYESSKFCRLRFHPTPGLNQTMIQF
ncbi:hypothetical protein ACE01N_11400, partial [Saccharicrinis sp. FJH2]|uniref:hypothetical protein n=1 Tax=Saccharicrinis sp. FJH65 TaxID=3344659 RepID=UPI0035F22B90